MIQKAPIINVFNGKAGIEKALSDIIKTKKPFVGWGATDKAMEISPEFTKWYINKREELGITAKQLYVEGEGFLKTNLSELKPIPKEYSGPATTLIYGNKVAIFLWFLSPPSVIVIDSKETAIAYKAHFDFLWKTRVFTFDEILNSQLVQEEIKKKFNNNELEIVKRKKSFFIIQKKIENNISKRILLLPPNGTTTGATTGIKVFDENNSHSEASEVIITILGGVAPGRNGYSRIKNKIKLSYSLTREVKLPLKEKILSSHTPPITILKSDGFGFWHSLSNQSTEWVAIYLEKELRSTKEINWGQVFSQVGIPDNNHQKILTYINSIKEYGDEVFEKNPEAIKYLETYPSQERILQVLIKALNIQEYGKHEQCTIFAIILKVAKHVDTSKLIKIIEQAKENKLAPEFYLSELEKKIRKKG